jgi:glycosyltransferase involved in cell wall biosynthesis
VVPAFNEARVIGEVVRELRASGWRVVVVDDGSGDATGEVAASAGARVLRHMVNRGQGAALQTGLAFALRRNARYVVTFDSDGQHSVDDIPSLLRPLLEGRVDVVLGSRFLGSAERLPVRRALLLRGAVLFTRLVSGLRVTDAHNGLRAFSAAAAERIHITLDRMAHASELLDQIGASGLPYVEVPVHLRYTAYSRGKGQRSTAAVSILVDYLLRRLLGA